MSIRSINEKRYTRARSSIRYRLHEVEAAFRKGDFEKMQASSIQVLIAANDMRLASEKMNNDTD